MDDSWTNISDSSTPATCNGSPIGGVRPAVSVCVNLTVEPVDCVGQRQVTEEDYYCSADSGLSVFLVDQVGWIMYCFHVSVQD